MIGYLKVLALMLLVPMFFIFLHHNGYSSKVEPIRHDANERRAKFLLELPSIFQNGEMDSDITQSGRVSVSVLVPFLPSESQESYDDHLFGIGFVKMKSFYCRNDERIEIKKMSDSNKWMLSWAYPNNECIEYNQKQIGSSGRMSK